MQPTKTHFIRHADAYGTGCSRPAYKVKRTSVVTSQVTCVRCRNSEPFVIADARQALHREEMFRKQEPRPRHTITGNPIECHECGGNLFRERPRSLDFYNYVCSGCGTECHPYTETGMCR